MIIVIDPDHVGSDSVAVEINENHEKEVVLKIAQEMIKKLSLQKMNLRSTSPDIKTH